MATIEPGSHCLVLGSGPLHLLTAKQAALAGYKTSVFTANDPEEALQLIYSEACPRGSLPLTFLSISDKEQCEKAIAAADAVMLVTDGESTVTAFAIDAVVPDPSKEPTKVKKIVAMSRNLNGKGLGFFSQSAKDFANPEVWAGAQPSIDNYKVFEEKIRSKAATVGADYTIVRAGTLKGGGPGAETATGSGIYPHAAYALSPKFYLLGMIAKPNWRMLFDMDAQGAKLVPGDTIEGPGLFAVKAATSWVIEKGDSGRLAVATAMVQSLSQENAANKDFAVCSAEARNPPTQSEWDGMFSKL